MKSLNKEELRDLINNDNDKIILFYSSECESCDKVKTTLDKHNINYYVIDCVKEPNYFIETYKVDLIPDLRVYHKKDIHWQKLAKLNDEEIINVEDYKY